MSCAMLWNWLNFIKLENLHLLNIHQTFTFKVIQKVLISKILFSNDFFEYIFKYHNKLKIIYIWHLDLNQLEVILKIFKD